MNISEASAQTKLPAKTIRYYEEIGLIHPGRSGNGYREYQPRDVHRLAFLQRSRSLGFSIEECRQLLALYDDQSRAAYDVKALAIEKLQEIDRKLEELKALRATLSALADSCTGDNRPDCPILNDLAGAPLVDQNKEISID